MIVSPEFLDRIDLSRLTRDLIKEMEKDLGTEHPQVHVAVRGIRSDREWLRFSRDYVLTAGAEKPFRIRSYRLHPLPEVVSKRH